MFPLSCLTRWLMASPHPWRTYLYPRAGRTASKSHRMARFTSTRCGRRCRVEGPSRGGMYRVTKEDFKSAACRHPFATGLGALDGLTRRQRAPDTEIKNTNSVVALPWQADDPHVRSSIAGWTCRHW
jgi:hypothetical protein